MNSVQLFKQVLWIAPGLIQMAIIWKMVKSGSRRQYPMFFNLMLFQTASWVLGQYLLAYASPRQYLYIYLANTMMSAALSFAVIYEIFGSVFKPYDALRDFAGVMFRWAGLVLLLMALVQALSSSGGDANRTMAGLWLLERSVSVIAFGLLLFLLLFAKNLGLSWKQQVFGIALGFGLSAAVEVGIWTARIVFGCPWTEAMNVLRGVTMNGTLLIWTYYVFSPERKTAEAFAPRLILERWNQVLRSVNRPAPQGAFMPSLERIVDDVMAHQPQGGAVH